jgi:hypothetical protein
MTAAQCICGFIEAEGVDETINDHLFEMFAPDDGKAADGLVHLEGEASLFCLCGVGGSVEELDAHFVAVFTPEGHIGRDGAKHEAAMCPGRRGWALRRARRSCPARGPSRSCRRRPCW